jgi:hypothetical protein
VLPVAARLKKVILNRKKLIGTCRPVSQSCAPRAGGIARMRPQRPAPRALAAPSRGRAVSASGQSPFRPSHRLPSGGGTDAFPVVFGQGSTTFATPEMIADFGEANTAAGGNQNIILFDVVGAGNLFVIFGEPDIKIEDVGDGLIRVKLTGVDIFKPQTGEVVSEGTDGIALRMLDTDYNEETFFVRHTYFLGANDPYKALEVTVKAEIDQEAWESLHADTSRPFPKPASGRIAVKVINHLGGEVMKVFGVRQAERH